MADIPNRAYLLPVEDTEFLLRDEMRGTRFMLEYEKAEVSLRDWGVRSTVIVFGSARTPSPELARAELAAAVGPAAEAQAQRRIAVGTRITARPPHRSVRAAFPHTAPTSGV